MASYTMELREIIEHYSQYEQNLTHKERIEKGRPKLFNFDYPFFDPEYKKTFETNFIRHFYMREIGFETEGLFQFYLESWLQLNMPYFNKLYESERLDYNPFESYDLKTDYTRTNDRNEQMNRDSSENATNKKLSDLESNLASTQKVVDIGLIDTNKNITNNTTVDQTSEATENSSNTTDQSSRNFNRDLTSQTPDSRLNITTNDGSGVIEYASEIKENLATSSQDNIATGETTTTSTFKDESSVTGEEKDVTTTNNTSDVTQDTTTEASTVENETNEKLSTDNMNHTDNQSETFTERKIGSIGVKTYQQMLLEYRETFIRIEHDIFREMNQLFMLVY